jgi:hypothetical protein
MVRDVKKNELQDKSEMVSLNFQGTKAREIHSHLVATLRTKIMYYGSVSHDR